MLYRLARLLVKIAFYIYFNIKVIGRENIPRQKGGYVIASNHVSNNDPPMVGIVFNGRYTFMAKAELFKNPLFGWLIRRLGAFPVNRGSKDMKAVDTAIESLKEGRIFIIFPEGTRSKNGELGRPKSGAAIVAARAEAPLVPVFIKYGKKRLWRRNALISIGKPLPAETFENLDIQDKKNIRVVSDKIMNEIAVLKEQAPEIK